LPDTFCKIKEVARHLLQNNEDHVKNMRVFLKRQLAQQLSHGSKRLPGALRNWIAKKTFQFVPSAPSALHQEEALEENLSPTASPVAEEAKTSKRHCIRPLKETANWWSQFLTKIRRLVLQNDKKH
jgi:hypothetical protein